jgi:hypothetical protein
MKLEKQVCTVDQARRLSELGIVQEGCYSWGCNDEFDNIPPATWTLFRGIKWIYKSYCAFTAAELGAMLPDYTVKLGNLEIGKCETDHVSMKPLKEGWWNVSYWTWSHKTHSKGGFYLEQKSDHLHQAPTLAQAMAAMLIYLIEKKLVKVKVINERIIAI